MSAVAFLAARFASSAWVGAAVLFVIVAVRQTTSGQFDHRVLAQLALLRFGPYYLAGAILIGLALVATVCVPGVAISRLRKSCVLLCLAGALGVMGYDYLKTYQPLAVMLQQSLDQPQALEQSQAATSASPETTPEGQPVTDQIADQAVEGESMSYLKPGSPLSASLPPEFAALHRQSERLNTLQLGLVLLAALLLNWPLARRPEPVSSAR